MKKKLENILFVSHPFVGTLVVILLCGLPWWLAYWPGTLQYDSCGQLLQYYGVGKMTGHHPLPATMLMGWLMDLGRALFHSDNAGLFLYTGLQFMAQSMVLSYAFCVYKQLCVPIWFRWMSLLFYAVFPLLPNWGISYVKDTGYYISFLLFILVLIDIFWRDVEMVPWKKQILWMISLLGMICFRNDGRYVVVITIIALFILVKKHRRICLMGAGMVLLFLVLVESVYMPLRNIPSGSVREAMSVPLMQTANYLKQHMEEVTEEERAILLSVFEVGDLEEIAKAYDEQISDEVKGRFLEYPKKEELFSYLKVWWMQFVKHPGTYIQAYLNHCDGYFNPTERCYEDIIGWFGMLDGQSRSDEYLDIYFGVEDRTFRDKLEAGVYMLYEIPVVGWLYRPAVHTLMMLGCCICLLMQRRKQALYVLLPGIMVLLICTMSPLNASVRYYLPVMATTPIYIAFCMIGKMQGKGIYEKTIE